MCTVVRSIYSMYISRTKSTNCFMHCFASYELPPQLVDIINYSCLSDHGPKFIAAKLQQLQFLKGNGVKHISDVNRI